MSNTFGQLLNSYRGRRGLAIDNATRELDERNGVTPENQQQFKTEYTDIKLPSGTDVTEVRLWKLVDASVVKMKAEVTDTVEHGITALGDHHSDPTHPSYIAPEESW